MRQKCVAIVGPTASGKSALGIALAKTYNGEVVSADSRQIYRGMDIGTAKPFRDRGAKSKGYVSEGIRHHLIDIRNPNQSYTLAHYKRDAVRAIHAIVSRGKLPIIVGGTGLYVSAVTENWSIPSVKPNPTLREKLALRTKHEGIESVYHELIKHDPEAACIVDSKNPRRVIRALEVALAAQKPFSVVRAKGPPLFSVLTIGIALPKPVLQERIDKRVQTMIQAGLIPEVKRLIRIYGLSAAPFDAIGYREIIHCLAGRVPLEDAIADIKKNTWSYAKRQVTWFKKDTSIVWISRVGEAGKTIARFLQQHRKTLSRIHI
jgi:tRNA dimethylallyltransferase